MRSQVCCRTDSSGRGGTGSGTGQDGDDPEFLLCDVVKSWTRKRATSVTFLKCSWWDLMVEQMLGSEERGIGNVGVRGLAVVWREVSE